MVGIIKKINYAISLATSDFFFLMKNEKNNLYLQVIKIK
jgi:hypothetical protein